MLVTTTTNLDGEDVVEFVFGDESGHNNAVFTDRRITNDFRKLNGLIQEKQIDRGYFCYLYFDEKQSNNQLIFIKN